MNKLEAASAAVTERRKNISDIRAAIAAQEEIVAENERHRQAHTLQAAMGDVAAKEALAKILHEDLAAERTLADLRKALPQSERELANAELSQKAAEAEFRKKEVERLARERVEAAAAIDQALADFSAAWSKYESLGRELFAAACDFQNQISLSETFDGMARLSAALPAKPFYDLRHRHSFAPIGTSSSLAAAESSYWRLPPAEVKAA
jgi:chromosome segregation ATPase